MRNFRSALLSGIALASVGTSSAGAGNASDGLPDGGGLLEHPNSFTLQMHIHKYWHSA